MSADDDFEMPTWAFFKYLLVLVITLGSVGGVMFAAIRYVNKLQVETVVSQDD
jgi:hypothetical protein